MCPLYNVNVSIFVLRNKTQSHKEIHDLLHHFLIGYNSESHQSTLSMNAIDIYG